MAQIQTLIRLMQSLKEPLQTCIRCGTCQTLCPLFAVTGREQDVARGKLALLTGLSQEMFQNPTGVFERLNRCLLCGACASGCPRGVDTLEIFLKARAIIAERGLSPADVSTIPGAAGGPKALGLNGLGLCATQYASEWMEFFCLDT